MTKDKLKLVALGQQLAAVGTQFRTAQIELEKTVEKYGMSSPQAGEAACRCNDLAQRFSQLEEEFLALKAHILHA